MKRKLSDCSGKISVLEMILIVFIVLMSGFVAYKCFEWVGNATAHGNDSLLANTAASEAAVNSNNGQECVVQNCPSRTGGVCAHIVNSDGATVGYLDKVTKHIVGEKPYGYNEYTEMDIGEEEYFGDKNTMVIQVKAEKGAISVSWVPGRTD
jgi:hypothetical protein